MAEAIIRKLINAGIHFGHRVSRWNPKMEPYILTKRNSIHIIDPKETLRGLLAAKKFFTQLVSEGKDVLLVGTKRQARKAIQTHAQRVGMHYVTERWLGGTLTNFDTIRSRVATLEKLEQMEADGTIASSSKKEGARLQRELRKIRRNLEGIRNMTTLPGALFVVDALREIIALREARKLKIPTVALIDTDSDPDMVDIPIPGNDDGVRAIEIIVEEICNAIELGKMSRSDKAEPAQPATTIPRIASSVSSSPQAPKDEEGFKNEPSQPAPENQSTPQPTLQMDKQPDAAVSIGAQNDQDIATENHKSRDESIDNLPDQQEDKQQDEQRE